MFGLVMENVQFRKIPKQFFFFIKIAIYFHQFWIFPLGNGIFFLKILFENCLLKICGKLVNTLCSVRSVPAILTPKFTLIDFISVAIFSQNQITSPHGMKSITSGKQIYRLSKFSNSGGNEQKSFSRICWTNQHKMVLCMKKESTSTSFVIRDF